MNHYTRPNWDDYFLEIMDTVSKRATCDRGRAACVIVKDNQLLVSGYVGAPKGLPHCDEVGHLIKKVIHVDEDNRESQHCVRTVHAEQNAICQAAKRGVAIDGATLYCRMTPCRTCAMLIINCGISRIVCQQRYQLAEESEAMFREAGLVIIYKHQETLEYKS
ncbi:MAG: cytidine/deoxycytidylate deaminase family protein [Chitinophagales bacterium]|jgi:dCMP deaminase|nr:cytidine/deoxycytidylate deaminase family protein [Chitinophagales bacterium]